MAAQVVEMYSVPYAHTHTKPKRLITYFSSGAACAAAATVSACLESTIDIHEGICTLTHTPCFVSRAVQATELNQVDHHHHPYSRHATRRVSRHWENISFLANDTTRVDDAGGGGGG